MNEFLIQWADAAYTSTGFFWMALWAFILGYALSSLIQVFVSESKMKNLMGDSSFKSLFMASFFGFISSSCSFSALATTKTLFQKGASFIASIGFLLASTNLVIELGIVISIFLGWQFIVGEYAGGLLLIVISWLLVALIKPEKLIRNAREHLDHLTGKDEEHSHSTSKSNSDHHDHGGEQMEKTSHDASPQHTHMSKWDMVGQKYLMEWNMVWKDVTVGFTIAGLIAAFVPRSFFQTLFINIGNGTDYSFLTLLEHVIVGPAVAFLTFIGSMGNIPLAALLYDNGVSFAGIMAFIFSDLVVLPVLRINAKYYGWKMSLFILFLLFTALVGTSLILHYVMQIANVLPQGAVNSIIEQDHFQLNYTTFLNIGFILLSIYLIYKAESSKHKGHNHEMAPKSILMEKVLTILAVTSIVWLVGGILLRFFIL